MCAEETSEHRPQIHCAQMFRSCKVLVLPLQLLSTPLFGTFLGPVLETRGRRFPTEQRVLKGSERGPEMGPKSGQKRVFIYH